MGGLNICSILQTRGLTVQQSTVTVVLTAVHQSRELRGAGCQLEPAQPVQDRHNDSVHNVSLSFQDKIPKKEMGEPERGVTVCDTDISDQLCRLHLQ